MRCDFCFAEIDKPAATIHAQAKMIAEFAGGQEVEDDGEWAACEDCAAVIQAQDWETLTERAVVGLRATLCGYDHSDDDTMRVKFRVILRLVFGLPGPDAFVDLR